MVRGLLSDQLNRGTGLLSAPLPRMDFAPALASVDQAIAQRPAQPKRERVSGWRVFDRVLGGQTVSDALDTERARLTAEAARPSLEAQRARLAEIARGMGPTAEAAFALNPDQFGKSLAEQFAPQVIASGGVQSVAGTGQRIGAPVLREFGDTLQQYDPTTGALSEVASRGPTIAEQNVAERNRIDAIGAGQNTVGRYRIDADGNTVFEAPQEFTLSQGQTRFADGAPVAAVAPTERNQAPTEGQAKDGFNAGRMERSGKIIADLEGRGFDYGASRLTGGQFREGGRQYEAAALEWTDAMLRLTSGAQAPETEVRQQMKAYFPQPGDSEAVRRQKAEMRREAEIAAAQRAGPGYRQGGSPSGQPVRVSSVAEARALPSGTVFIDPNGVRRRVP